EYVGWAAYDENALAPLLGAAEIQRKRGDFTGATRMLELSLFIHPYDPDVFSKLAETAMAAKDWGAAVAACRTLVGLKPSDLAGAHYSLAQALLGSGKPQEARRETLRALEIAPTFEKAQALLLKLSSGQP